MKAPPNLNEAGERAWKEALQAIEDLNSPEGRFEEAATRYTIAVNIAHELEGDWTAKGRPTMTKGGATGKVDVAHPLIKAVLDCHATAAKFGTELGLGPQARKKLGVVRGRPQERVPAKDNEAGRPSKVVPIRKSG